MSRSQFLDSEGSPQTDYALAVGLARRRAEGVDAPGWTHELTTDERGELDLANLFGGLAVPPEGEQPFVFVVLGARDELTPSVLAARTLGATRGAAAVVVRAPRALAPLRGVVVDAATGAPLADYALRIHSWLDIRAPLPAPGLSLVQPEMLRVHQRVGSPIGDWAVRWSHEPVTSLRLLGFTPGRHRLDALTRPPFDDVAAEPIVRELDLPLTEALVLAPRLAASAATYDLEVVVRTASGAALDGRDGRAELLGLQPQPRGVGGSVEWAGGVGKVTLRDVPEGRVQLQPHWARGWFPLVPDDTTFEVPGEPREVLVRDDLPTEELVVRVIEPEVGGRVSFVLGSATQRTYSSTSFGLEDLVVLPDGRRAYVLASGPFPGGPEVARVELTMDAHERVWLSGADLPAPDAVGKRVIELIPRRGWNARVEVVTSLADGHTPAVPAPPLVLAFDGLEAPASDGDGLLVHRAVTEPERVTLVTPGWVLVPRTSYLGRGTVHADGRVSFDDGALTVLVRRAD